MRAAAAALGRRAGNRPPLVDTAGPSADQAMPGLAAPAWPTAPAARHRCPRLLAPGRAASASARARAQTNLGPGRLAGMLGRARSTIWKVLHRRGHLAPAARAAAAQPPL